MNLKVSPCISNVKPQHPVSAPRTGRHACHSVLDNNTIIIPVDKCSCTVLPNHTDCHENLLSLLSDKNTCKPLKRDPGSCCGKKVTDCPMPTEVDNPIDWTSYHRLDIGDATSSLCGLPKLHCLHDQLCYMQYLNAFGFGPQPVGRQMERPCSEHYGFCEEGEPCRYGGR